MSTTFTKVPLSGASNATRQILVSGTTSGSATLIHSSVASISSASLDEVWLYAYNESTASNLLSILWGGTTEPNDVTRYSIPPQAGRTLVTDGKLLYNNLSISAYASLSNTIAVDGFVNRITADSSSIIDPVVINWANRVVLNGGTYPSSSTLSALTIFLQSLYAANIYIKMKTVNCYVPDSLSASITPLIVNGNDPWTNYNFVSGDLTVNGLLGDGSSKYLNIGFNPLYGFPNDTSAGMTIYLYSIVNWAGENTIGGGTNFSTNLLDLAIDQSSNSFFQCWGGGSSLGQNTIVGVFNGGFVSGNRTSASSMKTYIANSTTPLSSSADSGGTYGTRPDKSMLAHAINYTSAPNSYSKHRFSFAAIHLGLTSTEVGLLYNAVQTLRQSFGGGYV